MHFHARAIRLSKNEIKKVLTEKSHHAFEINLDCCRKEEIFSDGNVIVVGHFFKISCRNGMTCVRSLHMIKKNFKFFFVQIQDNISEKFRNIEI